MTTKTTFQNATLAIAATAQEIKGNLQRREAADRREQARKQPILNPDIAASIR